MRLPELSPAATVLRARQHLQRQRHHRQGHDLRHAIQERDRARQGQNEQHRAKRALFQPIEDVMQGKPASGASSAIASSDCRKVRGGCSSLGHAGLTSEVCANRKVEIDDRYSLRQLGGLIAQAGVAELVDARDSKSRFPWKVSVRARPPVPLEYPPKNDSARARSRPAYLYVRSIALSCTS